MDALLSERNSQRSIARLTGVARMSLPAHYRRHCWLFRDQWKAYAQVLLCWQHRPNPKGEGQTGIVEAINCSLRQQGGVLVRKSCSFSKSLVMHIARIKIVIDNYNLTL